MNIIVRFPTGTRVYMHNLSTTTWNIIFFKWVKSKISIFFSSIEDLFIQTQTGSISFLQILSLASTKSKAMPNV